MQQWNTKSSPKRTTCLQIVRNEQYEIIDVFKVKKHTVTSVLDLQFIYISKCSKKCVTQFMCSNTGELHSYTLIEQNDHFNVNTRRTYVRMYPHLQFRAIYQPEEVFWCQFYVLNTPIFIAIIQVPFKFPFFKMKSRIAALY